MRRRVVAGLAAVGWGARSARGQESGCDPRVWHNLPATPTLPPPRQTGVVRVGGAELWFGGFGRAGSGSPIVLLHGGLANSDYWGAVIPTLTARRPVWALDTRGHGRSTLGDAPLSYARMAADVVGLLDQLGIERADVAGWSDGAIVGLQMAMAARRRVNRLFAFAANSDPSGLVPGGAESATFRRFKERAAAEHRALSPQPERYGELVAQLGRMWRREPAFGPDDLARIEAPTTIAAAAHDEIISRRHSEALADALAGAIGGARLVVLPCVDHFALLQDPVGFGRRVIEALEG